jgi:predicted HD superfamily hydrolase involved in NAD metabolism
LRERLSQERWRHTLSVAETSYRIATALNWPAHERERVMLAALLHDVAKELPAESQLQLAGISSEQVDGKGPLLHALAGAALASREYDVADEGVLEAIACHPTGSAGEAPLVQLLFVADYLEPLRPHLDGEDRDLLERALAGGLALPALFCRVLEKKIARVRARGLPVHPRSVAAWRAHCERRG